MQSTLVLRQCVWRRINFNVTFESKFISFCVENVWNEPDNDVFLDDVLPFSNSIIDVNSDTSNENHFNEVDARNVFST